MVTSKDLSTTRFSRLPSEAVGEIVCARVPTTTPGTPAREIRAALAGRRFESIVAVAVCEGERLAGLIRIEDLMAAGDQVTATELMDADPPPGRHDRSGPGTGGVKGRSIDTRRYKEA